MKSNIEKLKDELKELLLQGSLLYYAMQDSCGQLSQKDKDDLEKKKIDLPSIGAEYETWYSESLRVIKQIIPERLDDFVKQYKNEKRKGVDILTYGISDYLLALRVTIGGRVVADEKAAILKMNNQISILESANKRFESALFDIQEVLQADLFDCELSAARELAKKGFVRGGGAIAGVVLERHLGHVCATYNLKSRKKTPSISDFYQLLKEANVIDTAKWRFIQHLGDLRNLCDHSKDRDPTKDDVSELVEGVEKIIKTVI